MLILYNNLYNKRFIYSEELLKTGDSFNKFCCTMIEFRRVRRSMLCRQSNATRLLAECQAQLVNSGIASSVGQIFRAQNSNDGLSVTGINYCTCCVIFIILLACILN